MCASLQSWRNRENLTKIFGNLRKSLEIFGNFRKSRFPIDRDRRADPDRPEDYRCAHHYQLYVCVCVCVCPLRVPATTSKLRGSETRSLCNIPAQGAQKHVRRPKTSILPFILVFMVPNWLRPGISSADFRVQLEILKVPYGELFFVAPTRLDLGSRAGSIKSREINDFSCTKIQPKSWIWS